MPIRFSIRRKLFLYTLAILLAAYSILFFAIISRFNAVLNQEMNRDLEGSLGYAKSRYLSRAELIKGALQLPLSAGNVLERIVKSDHAWLQDAVVRWHKTLGFVDYLVVVDPQKRVIARLSGKPGGDTFRLERLLATAFQSRQPLVTSELISREDFCRDGEAASCKALDKDSELLMVTVVLPVIGRDGALLGGVVVGDVVNKDPHQPVQLQKILGARVEMSITQQGERIASSEPHGRDLAAMLDHHALKELQNGFSYRGKGRFDNREYQMAIEPITNSSGAFVGSVAVAVAAEDFARIRRENLQGILVAAGLGLLLVPILTFLVARRLSNPLSQLVSGTAEIAAGLAADGHGRQLPVTGNDEFGVLAANFNRMVKILAERDWEIRRKTEDLQELNELLEMRVVDRTAKLRLEMGMLEAILTSMVEGVVVTDRKNRIIHFNPAAEKIFNIYAQDVLGEPIDAVCSQGDFCKLASQIQEISKEPAQVQVLEIELSVRKKKLKVTVSPLVDEGEHYSGFVMSIRDVTLEYELERMKNDFLATVSHELKTPLTSMKGSLQYIIHKGKWLTGNERELLGICLRNTDRLIRLITSILELSKIEAGKIEFVMRPQIVGELLIYALEEVKGFAMHRNISVVNNVSSELPMIYGDHDRLIQVLSNLLSNAVKFSPNDTVVMVSAERQGDFVAISVADNGKVIRPADRDKLFTKFQQLEPTESNEYSGTGLGLAICREIVEKHGGRIYYQASLTGGNLFTFTVPIFGGKDEQRQNTDS